MRASPLRPPSEGGRGEGTSHSPAATRERRAESAGDRGKLGLTLVALLAWSPLVVLALAVGLLPGFVLDFSNVPAQILEAVAP